MRRKGEEQATDSENMRRRGGGEIPKCEKYVKRP